MSICKMETHLLLNYCLLYEAVVFSYILLICLVTYTKQKNVYGEKEEEERKNDRRKTSNSFPVGLTFVARSR